MKLTRAREWSALFLLLAALVALVVLARHPEPSAGSALPVNGAPSRAEITETPKASANGIAIETKVPKRAQENGQGAIGGRVRSREGLPVASVSVALASARDVDVSVDSADVAGKALDTETDSEGRFLFSNLQSGAYIVTAHREGLGGSAETVLSKKRSYSEIEITLGSGGAFAGRVVDASGNGVPTARVYPVVHDRYPVGERQSRGLMAECDQAGNFRFPFLEAQSWSFMAEAPGFTSGMSDQVPSGTEDIQITMTAGIRITGRVVDAVTGEGVAGMVLGCEQKSIPINARTTTDETGVFELSGVAPGDLRLWGTHRSHALVENPTTLMAEFGASAPLVLKASPGAQVRGRVVRPDGTGVSDIGVGIVGAYFGSGILTGEDGRYAFMNVPPGSYRVYSMVLDPREQRTVEVSPGSTTDLEDWILTTGIIQGEVLDEAGSLVSGATVYVSATVPLEQSQTDGQGKFQIAGPDLAGKVVVVASDLDRSSAPVSVDLDVDPIPTVVLVLDRLRGTVAGQVVDRQGKPRMARLTFSSYAGFPIPERIQAVGVDRAASPEADSPSGTGRWDIAIATDAEGYFTTTVSTPGAVKIYMSEYKPHMVFDKSLLATELDLSAGESRADLRLVWPTDSGRAISGKVQDTSGGPLSNVDVMAFVREGGGDGGSAFTDADGQFRIESLQGESYTLTAKGRGRRTELPNIEAGATGVIITMKEAPRVFGFVRDSGTGAPVTEFEIAWVDSRQPNTRFAQYHLVSHAEGRFELEAPEGSDAMSMDLVAQARGRAQARVTMGIIYESSGPFQISLERSATVSGMVVDEAGAPVSGARICAWSPIEGRSTGEMMTATSGADGTFQLASLPASAERLESTHPNFAPAQAPLAPGETDAVVLVMTPGAELDGVITREGHPVEGAQVRIRDGELNSQATDAQGHFYFEGLGAGTATLDVALVDPEGQRVRYSVDVDLTGGARNSFSIDIQGGEVTLTE